MYHKTKSSQPQASIAQISHKLEKPEPTFAKHLPEPHSEEFKINCFYNLQVSDLYSSLNVVMK